MTSSQPTENNNQEPILDLEQVQSGMNSELSIRLNRFSGRLLRGNVVQVPLDRHHAPQDLVSLILGLSIPEAGRLLFDGMDWLGKEYSRHFQMRRQIGRVFSGAAWIQNLTVAENLRLSPLHHGQKMAEVKEKIEHWTERISGSRLDVVQRSLKRRPAFVEPAILQICQFIRALSIQPILLILERPTRLLPEDLYGTLVSSINELRNGGMGVLWFAGTREEQDMTLEKKVSRWNIVNDELINTEAN